MEDPIIKQEGRDLRAERAKYLPKNINTSSDSLTINGGIGDGRNDGGPAYFIEAIVDKDADSMENEA